MCGRAACTLCPDDIQKACGYRSKYSKKFQKPKWKESNSYNQYKPSHNIAPTDVLPVLMSGSQVEESERIIQPMIWGMIPPWHKGDPKAHGLTSHNCRLESMLSSKLYSTPFSKGYRCVVVCDGFYEWQTTKGNKNKQPYFIYSPQPEGIEIETPTSWESDWSDSGGWKGPQLLKMAGLFQIFKNSDGDEIYSCTIITMESEDTLSWLHHRTPAILQSDDQVLDWLDVGNIPAKKALELLKPSKALTWHPVSTIVNNSRNKDIDCNKRVSLSTPQVKRTASSSFMESWLKKGSPTKKTVGNSRHLLESGTVHGLAFWFDVAFIGKNSTVWLSTAPSEPLTHWYQVRCLLETPIFVKAGQLLTGRVLLVANQRQSYDVTIELCVEGTGTRSSNTLDLKNPYFRYTGQAAQPPPGVNHSSPSEAYWSQLDAQGARQAVNMVNGISVNGLGEVALDAAQTATNLMGLGSQPNIHPGSITSTGRQRIGSGTATSTQAAQLIGGGISPTLFTSPQTHQLVLGNTSHYPVNNSLMIGDYVTPGSTVLSAQSYRQ